MTPVPISRVRSIESPYVSLPRHFRVYRNISELPPFLHVYCYHLVRQVGSRRVTNSILQYNQAAFISETMLVQTYMVWVLLDYFKGQGQAILLESTVKTGTGQLGASSVWILTINMLRDNTPDQQ